MKTTFKIGDHIYYRHAVDNTFDTIPGIVIRISTTGRLTIKDGDDIYRNVKPTKCELQ